MLNPTNSLITGCAFTTPANYHYGIAYYFMPRHILGTADWHFLAQTSF